MYIYIVYINDTSNSIFSSFSSQWEVLTRAEGAEECRPITSSKMGVTVRWKLTLLVYTALLHLVYSAKLPVITTEVKGKRIL